MQSKINKVDVKAQAPSEQSITSEPVLQMRLIDYSEELHPLRRSRSSGWLGSTARAMLVLVSLLVLLAGCTLPSDKTSLPIPDAAPPAADSEQATIDARELLEEAIHESNSSEAAQRFWFRGYARNALQNEHITSMFDGVISRPLQGFIVNGRIAAQPFQYYGYEGECYMNSRGRWYELEDDDTASLPFDPFFGFADWLPLVEEAVQLPDEEVLGNKSEVIEVKLSAKEWVQRSPSALFTELQDQLSASDDIDRILENTVVKTTFWIGKEDRIIYQNRTWFVMPLPAGGYYDQETTFTFFRHGDSSIEKTHLPTPEKVRQWIQNPDEEVEQMDVIGG